MNLDPDTVNSYEPQPELVLVREPLGPRITTFVIRVAFVVATILTLYWTFQAIAYSGRVAQYMEEHRTQLNYIDRQAKSDAEAYLATPSELHELQRVGEQYFIGAFAGASLVFGLWKIAFSFRH